MSPLSCVCGSQEASSVTLSRFKELLSNNNLDYDITWRWSGRCRQGVIEVYDVALGLCDGVVERQGFERNMHGWKERDTVLGRMHAESPKHKAVRALTMRLQKLSS